LENFPYQRLRKAARTTVIEAAAEMAAGTTGTAFNVLTMTPDPLPEYVPLYDQIAAFRPLWARMQAELGRSTVRGVWPAWNQDAFAAVNPEGSWLTGGKLEFHSAYTLAEIGLPLAYGVEGAAVTALCGSTVLAFSQGELRRIFSGGVLLDVDAWRALKQLGLGNWTGIGDGGRGIEWQRVSLGRLAEWALRRLVPRLPPVLLVAASLPFGTVRKRRAHAGPAYQLCIPGPGALHVRLYQFARRPRGDDGLLSLVTISQPGEVLSDEIRLPVAGPRPPSRHGGNLRPHGALVPRWRERQARGLPHQRLA
jgi:hypothetical protein